MKSILQDGRKCLICNFPLTDLHHVRLGNCSRKKAEKYGTLVYLCRKHHDQLHHDEKLKRKIQQLAQSKLETKMTHEEYMKIFKKNYLGEKD